MEKKMWTTPRVDFIKFAANEYISSCRNDQGQRLYNFFCDTTFGDDTDWIGAIFYDNNNNGVLDFVGRDLDENGSAIFTPDSSYAAWDGASFDNYGDAFAYAANYNNGADQFVMNFNSCNATVQTTSTSIFQTGFYVPYDNNYTSGNLLTGNYQQVTIWHGENGNQLHVTTQLQEEILNTAAFS